jgi:phosphoserine phosphatase
MQGHQDSPLTELGIMQAQWLGERFNPNPPHLIYSSSSYRAYRTAELIREKNDLEIIQTDDFKEINLGEWEGKTQPFIKENYTDKFDNFWNNPEVYIPDGGETFIDVQRRAINKLLEILNLHKGKDILIVSHTVVVKLIMAYFEKRKLKDLWKPPYIHPVSLCQVQIINEFPNILLHGDTTHYK